MTSLLRHLADEADLPFTFGVNRWFEDGAVFTPDAIAMVSHVMAEECLEGHLTGVGRFRTSLIGDNCARKHVLSYLGVPKAVDSAFSMNRMMQGNWDHLRWQAIGLSAGVFTDIEVPYEIADWEVSGPMDALMADGSGFELKTTGSRIYTGVIKSGPKYEHLMQCHLAIKALDLEAYSIVYVNRDTTDWREFRFRPMPDVLAALDMRMAALLAARRDRVLPPMYHKSAADSCSLGVGATWKGCAWAATCPSATWQMR